MKSKLIKVKLKKITTGLVRHGRGDYEIVRMVNTVALFGYGGNKDYTVGTRLTEAEAQALAAYRNIEVTVE